MPGTRPIVASLPSTLQVDKQIADSREITARAMELLRSEPKPDTFIGRKTQDPFPQEDDPEQTKASAELKAPA